MIAPEHHGMLLPGPRSLRVGSDLLVAQGSSGVLAEHRLSLPLTAASPLLAWFVHCLFFSMGFYFLDGVLVLLLLCLLVLLFLASSLRARAIVRARVRRDRLVVQAFGCVTNLRHSASRTAGSQSPPQAACPRSPFSCSFWDCGVWLLTPTSM